LQVLPIRIVEGAVDEKLLDLALKHGLAVYNACYLGLAPLATVGGKLQMAAENA
jgi:hypothetical protein